MVAGCVHTAALDRREAVDDSAGHFIVRHAEIDDGAAQQISTALRHAGPQLSMWGVLGVPVVVTVEPSHDALERAVDRRGYGWLRAWARYREVFVQSPRTWGLLAADQGAVDELLTHELTHCLMYQLAAGESDWSTRGIPLWFREGLASFTAGQGYRRGTLESLATFYDAGRGDPIAQGEALYQRQSEVVYGAAHLAFTFLVQRYGIEAVRALLARMHAGAGFDAAFAQAVGLSRTAFERDFATYVRLRGFMGAPVPPAVKQASAAAGSAP
jgi:hypothetical protein